MQIEQIRELANNLRRATNFLDRTPWEEISTVEKEGLAQVYSNAQCFTSTARLAFPGEI